MSNPRAVRYRRLALVEQDNKKAELLRLIADEADRGVLHTPDWTSKRYGDEKSEPSVRPIEEKP